MSEYKITDINYKIFKTEELKAPLVSVTIPTYNEEKTLPYTLMSIKKQTYPSIEVIVIDSSSVDGTKNIAEKFGAKVINYGRKIIRGKVPWCKGGKWEICSIVRCRSDT